MDLPRPDFLRSGTENPHLDLPRPSAETIFLLYIGEKIFCARARRIHLWNNCVRARNRFSSLYKRENFCARARRIHLWIYRARIFCARARRIHIWIYRARARKRFSSLYRGENFLHSGAENPPFGTTAPERGTDFLLYIKEKISALGRGESTFGSTAPGFSALGRGESTFGSTAVRFSVCIKHVYEIPF